MKATLQKYPYILLVVLNIVLIIDFPIMVLFGQLFPKIHSFSLVLYRIDYLELGNQYTFYTIGLVIQFILLVFTLFIIIRGKYNSYIQILLKSILILYGISFIYQYLFWNIIGFSLSILFKYIILSISIILLHNYFKQFDTKHQHYWFFSKKVTLILVIIFSLPFLLLETLHFTSNARITDENIEKTLQAIIDYRLKNDSLDEIVLQRRANLNYRNKFCEAINGIEISLPEKAYMYSQINTDKILKWDNFHLSNVSLYSDDINNFDSLKSVNKAHYIYYYSKPIFNYVNDFACITVFGQYIPEPSRYSQIETYFLEKKNNLWNVVKISERNTGF